MASDSQIQSYYERSPEESRYGFGHPVYYVKNDRTALINLYNERLTLDGRKPCMIISWFGCSTNNVVSRPAAFDNTAGYACIPDRDARAWQLIPRELLSQKYNGR